MTDRETIAIYNAKVADYTRLAGDTGPDATLAAFMADLPKGARVLDLGCGPGTSAVHMMKRGFEVCAIDATEGFVEAARARGVDAHLGTFDDVDEVAAYDGVWANFSLLHAPKSHMSRHLAAIATALKPGGLAHIALKTGDGEKRDTLGRFYAYYTDTELTGLLETAGLTVLRRKFGEDAGLAGDVSPWIAVTARRG